MPSLTPYTSTESLSQEGYLSQRAFECLSKTGLFNLKDIVDYVKGGNRVSDIMGLDGVSDLQIRYLLLIRKLYGEKIEPATIAPILLDVADVTFKEIFSRVFNQKISSPTQLNINPYLGRRYPNLESLFAALVAGTDNIFQIQPSLNGDELREYRLWHIEFLEELIPQLPTFIKIKHPLFDPFSRLHKDAKKLYVQYYIRKTLNPLKARWSTATDVDIPSASSSSVSSSSSAVSAENNTISGVETSEECLGLEKHSADGTDSNAKTSLSVQTHNPNAESVPQTDLNPKKASDVTSDIPVEIMEEFSDFLQQRYEVLSKKTLGPWGGKFLQEYLPGYKDAVSFFNRPLDDYCELIPARTFRKNLAEIYRLVQLFHQEVEDIIHKYAQGGRKALLQYQCQCEYPFLSEEECIFTVKFIEQHNRRPLFFLLYRFLPWSQKREVQCFSLYHGLSDGRNHSLEEIASQMRITSHRVRVIISSHQSILDNLSVTPIEIDAYRQILPSPIITEDSDVFESLVEDEILPRDFDIFGALCSLILDYKIQSTQDVRFLLSPSFDSNRVKTEVISKFNPVCNKVHTVDTFYPFTYFTDGIPEELHPQVKWLLSVLVKGKHNVSLTEDGVLVAQTKLDISQELYQILSEHGSPLTLEELFVRFKEKYPEHKYTEPSQIRYFLLSHEHILPLGNQAVYGLDSWENVYFGTIRDLIFETLHNNPIPMQLEELLSEVTKHYPTTSLDSLRTTIGSDPYNRFVRFEGGYYGSFSRYYPSKYVLAKGTKNKNTKVTHTDRDFDKHLKLVEFFIQRNHRFPFKNGSLEEAALSRWVDRALAHGITLSKNQKESWNALIEKFSDYTYPRNPREYSFMLRCQEFKDYIQKHHTLPTAFTDNALYSWFRVNKERYNQFADNRRYYFRDLCNYLLSEGYDIKL